MLPFDHAFRDLAIRETRSFLFRNHGSLPDGKYLLREHYCTSPGCDCRRTLILVHWVEGEQVVASINYSFEPSSFEDEGQFLLDPLNPQSGYSEILVAMFEDMVTGDPEYQDRLIRHYEIWREAVDDEAHPQHAKLRSSEHDDPNFSPAFPTTRKPHRRSGPKIGANAPCPCGSGRKYKKCCRGKEGP